MYRSNWSNWQTAAAGTFHMRFRPAVVVSVAASRKKKKQQQQHWPLKRIERERKLLLIACAAAVVAGSVVENFCSNEQQQCMRKRAREYEQMRASELSAMCAHSLSIVLSLPACCLLVNFFKFFFLPNNKL